jgi:hypothetical protein
MKGGIRHIGRQVSECAAYRPRGSAIGFESLAKGIVDFKWEEPTGRAPLWR